MSNPTENKPVANVRSICPVACILDLMGDKWTLLVIRDLMVGKERFKEFSESHEKIPTNILSDRLERLVSHGVAEQFPIREGSKRMGYRLTEKGIELKPLMLEMVRWSLKWIEGTKVMMISEEEMQSELKKYGEMLVAEYR